MLGSQDVYLNVAGGLKINEPAIDLGMVVATVSSFKNMPIPKTMVIMGEVRFNRRSKKNQFNREKIKRSRAIRI